MKKMTMILAGLMLMVAATAFSEGQNISDDALGGAEAASPVNWDSDKLVWKTGKIDSIDSDGVVINDKGYHWSNFGVRFLGIDGTILDEGKFHQGAKVTFVLENDRKTIVTMIKGEVREETKD